VMGRGSGCTERGILQPGAPKSGAGRARPDQHEVRHGRGSARALRPVGELAATPRRVPWRSSSVNQSISARACRLVLGLLETCHSRRYRDSRPAPRAGSRCGQARDLAQVHAVRSRRQAHAIGSGQRTGGRPETPRGFMATARFWRCRHSDRCGHCCVSKEWQSR